MTTSQQLGFSEHDEVYRATSDDFKGDQQVVVGNFSGDGHTMLTFFCPDVASAEALVTALKACQKKRLAERPESVPAQTPGGVVETKSADGDAMVEDGL